MSKLISTNPARGYEEIGAVEISSETEVISKVAAAQKAKLSWKHTPLEERKSYFIKLLNLYKERGNAVAELQTKETGKPISQSLGDVEFDIDNIKAKLRLADECLTPKLLDESETQKNILYFEPHGVVAVIIP